MPGSFYTGTSCLKENCLNLLSADSLETFLNKSFQLLAKEGQRLDHDLTDVGSISLFSWKSE